MTADILRIDHQNMLENSYPGNRKSRHNAKVRQRIWQSAGKMFRVRGVENSSIDSLMAAADLTRGAFYAHFTAKDDLFACVVANDQALLDSLRRRNDSDERSLWAEMRAVFERYLTPDRLQTTFASCTMAALPNTVARGCELSQRRYNKAFDAILFKMVRGQDIDPYNANIVAALTITLGAVATASACADQRSQIAILSASHEVFRRLTSSARLQATGREIQP